MGQLTPLVFNFDTSEPVFIDTSITGNIWQIGNPLKPFFNGSLTFPNAMVTDTINPYPTNNVSEFIIKTPTCFGSCGVHMTFYHKYDTDSLSDGGTILVSNNGASWLNIINSPAFTSFPYNYYQFSDSVSSLNDIGFSGHSNGWKQTWAYWNYPPTDTLWIKFKFASDNFQSSKDGWMIDSLVFNYDLGIGIAEDKTPVKYQLSPNPFKDNSILTFNQTESTAFLLIFSCTGQMVNKIENIYNGRVVINRENLKSGVYSFALIQSNHSIINGSLVIE